MSIIFEGLPPHELDFAHKTSALCVDETVVATLHINMDGEEPVPVRVAMSWRTAVNLSSQIEMAAFEAESKAAARRR